MQSNLSVIDAIMNIKFIIHMDIGILKNSPCILKNGIITKIGTNIILNIVSLFAKFIFYLFLSFDFLIIYKKRKKENSNLKIIILYK